MLQKTDQAIEHYQKAISLNPEKSETYYNLGNAYCVVNKFADAIVVYKKSIELDSYNPPAFYNLGNAYYMLG